MQKKKQNRQQKWIKLIIVKKKQQKEHNDSALGLGEGKGTKICDHLHTSKKKQRQQTVSQKLERKKREIIYTHMYIIQYATMQDGRT